MVLRAVVDEVGTRFKGVQIEYGLLTFTRRLWWFWRPWWAWRRARCSSRRQGCSTRWSGRSSRRKGGVWCKGWSESHHCMFYLTNLESKATMLTLAL